MQGPKVRLPPPCVTPDRVRAAGLEQIECDRMRRRGRRQLDEPLHVELGHPARRPCHDLEPPGQEPCRPLGACALSHPAILTGAPDDGRVRER